MGFGYSGRQVPTNGLSKPYTLDDQHGTGVRCRSSREGRLLAQPSGFAGGQNTTTEAREGFEPSTLDTALQAVAFDHSATAPPADPISPLAAPLRGKRFPSVIVEDRGFATPCHVWQGSLNSKGYATRFVGGRAELLHRLICAHHHGPIPEGHDAHHLCGQKPCVNPAHLSAVSRLEHGRHHSTGIVQRAIEYMAQHGGWHRVPDIVDALGEPAARDAVRVGFMRAVRRGEIERGEPGRFRRAA